MGFYVCGMMCRSSHNQACNNFHFTKSGSIFTVRDTLWTKTYFPDEDTIYFIGRSLESTLDGGFIIRGDISKIMIIFVLVQIY